MTISPIDVRTFDPGPRLFWEDQGAHIQRQQGRAMFGDAVGYNGRLPGTGDTTWPSALRTASIEASQVASISTIGHNAILGASRTSDNGAIGSMGTIGIYGLVHNDFTVGAASAYGFYGEAWREIGAGITHGGEIDIINRGNTAISLPGAHNPAGLTEGWRIASGGEDPLATTASVALSIVNNGAKFEKGILFGENALHSDIAIAMAQAHKIAWYYPGASIGARIDTSDGSHFYDGAGAERAHFGFSAVYGQPIINTKGFGLGLLGTVIAPTAGGSIGFLQLMVNGTAAKIQLLAT